MKFKDDSSAMGVSVKYGCIFQAKERKKKKFLVFKCVVQEKDGKQYTTNVFASSEKEARENVKNGGGILVSIEKTDRVVWI